MAPKLTQAQAAELFRPRLDEQIKMQHSLVRLATLIDWAEIECRFSLSLTSTRSCPALPARLIAGVAPAAHLQCL